MWWPALDLDRADFHALVPNRKGYELARASGIRSVGVVLSATETHEPARTST